MSETSQVPFIKFVSSGTKFFAHSLSANTTMHPPKPAPVILAPSAPKSWEKVTMVSIFSVETQKSFDIVQKAIKKISGINTTEASFNDD